MTYTYIKINYSINGIIYKAEFSCLETPHSVDHNSDSLSIAVGIYHNNLSYSGTPYPEIISNTTYNTNITYNVYSSSINKKLVNLDAISNSANLTVNTTDSDSGVDNEGSLVSGNNIHSSNITISSISYPSDTVLTLSSSITTAPASSSFNVNILHNKYIYLTSNTSSSSNHTINSGKFLLKLYGHEI